MGLENTVCLKYQQKKNRNIQDAVNKNVHIFKKCDIHSVLKKLSASNTSFETQWASLTLAIY